MKYFQQGLAYVKNMGDKVEEAIILYYLGYIHSDEGEYRRAASNFRKGYKIAEKYKLMEGLGFASNALGYNDIKAKDFSGAEQFYKKALEIGNATNNPDISIEALTGLSELYKDQEKLETTFKQLLAQ